jgi:O-acetyl-ADP-ribose deacetylase (regulator of RNase III)
MKKGQGLSSIKLVKKDITEMKTSAIVNPANKYLKLGGGVAGAIRKKGGVIIQKECDKIGGADVGTAVITTGGALTAKYVIHAVGPCMGEGNEDEKLRKATINSLKLADKYKLDSISFPAISTGIFGFPMQRCAYIMLDTVYTYLQQETHIQRVFFCLFDQDSLSIFQKEYRKLLF